MPSEIFFTALYRARLTVDDFGEIVWIVAPQYTQAVNFYLQEE
jgi:hypothetical protein